MTNEVAEKTFALSEKIESLYSRDYRVEDIAENLGMKYEDVRRTLRRYGYQHGIKRTPRNKITTLPPFVCEYSFPFLQKYL